LGEKGLTVWGMGGRIAGECYSGVAVAWVYGDARVLSA
jgi:hypothetical protein